MNELENFQFVVKVLGSGTCVPSKVRFPSAYFVKPVGSANGWLIDLGATALQRLAQAGESYQNLGRVFISHVHPDHSVGLLPLLQALNYTPGYQRTEPLIVYGPETVQRFLECNLNFAPSLRPSFPFEFVVLKDSETVQLLTCSVSTRQLEHSSLTLGYRFISDQRTLVYAADTEPCDALVELASEADVLILEASYCRAHPSHGHSTTFQAGQVARDAKVKRLLLSHFYPEVSDLEDSEREAEVKASGFDGEVIFASDLMELKV
jgi:ribonuclease BN (tRNA processing enzyme)